MKVYIVQRTASITLIPLALMLTAGCLHPHRVSAPLPGSPAGDSITLLSVSQIAATTLSPERAAHFSVHLRYTLTTYDHAVLSVGIVQFASVDSCTSDPVQIAPSVHNGDPENEKIAIVRGTHTIDTTLTWPGSEDDAKSSGAISLQSSMGLVSPPYQFLLRSFGTQFCERF